MEVAIEMGDEGREIELEILKGNPHRVDEKSEGERGGVGGGKEGGWGESRIDGD